MRQGGDIGAGIIALALAADAVVEFLDLDADGPQLADEDLQVAAG